MKKVTVSTYVFSALLIYIVFSYKQTDVNNFLNNILFFVLVAAETLLYDL